MEFIKIGNVANIHGIKGELSIYPYTDDIDNFCNYKKFFVGSEKKEYNVIRLRPHKNIILAVLDGIKRREEAELLKTKDVYISKDELKKLDKNSYYIDDLIGLTVIDNISKEEIGKIVNVIKYPSNDVYEVEFKNETFYIPAISEVVKKIDLKESRVYVELLEGLRW